MYTRFHQFIQILNETHQKDEVRQLRQQGFEQIIFHANKDHYVLPTLQGDQPLVEMDEALKLLNQHIEFIKIDEQDT